MSFHRKQAQQVDQFLEKAGGLPRFLLLAVDSPRPLAPRLAYLEGRLGAAASMRALAEFDGVQVIEFRCGAGPLGGPPDPRGSSGPATGASKNTFCGT